MQLSEKASITFIYSIVNHPYIGLVIEPLLVEKTVAGNFSLANQRLIYANAKLYTHLLDEADFAVIKILEEITPDNIVKKFYKKGAIRPKEFFEKKIGETMFKSSIRPFIERRLLEALELLDPTKLYFSSETKNPTAKHLTVCKDNVSILFHFNRTEIETRYYATIKVNNERLKILGNGNVLIYEPAHIIIDDKLIILKEVDGKKIEPFFSKYYISVARRSEEIFFKKFGLELIEKFNVKSEGFEIKQETHKASAVLKLEKVLSNDYGFILSFKYDGQVFPYHSKKMAHAIYEKNGDAFHFRKIRRSRDWEEHKREFIESLGLEQKEGSIFILKKIRTIPSDDLLKQTELTQKYETLSWLEKHVNALNGRGFEINQNLNQEIFFLGEKNLKIEISKQSDWFDLNTVVWFGSFEIPFIQLKENILNGNREFVLPNGEIAIIPEEWMAKFLGILRYNDGGKQLRIKKMHWGLLGDFETLPGIQSKLEGLQTFEEIKEIPLPKGLKGTLRDYQIAGYNWIYFLKSFGFGGCLADDMGLGKTVQTLALLQNEKEQLHPLTEKKTPLAVKGNVQLSIFENQKDEKEMFISSRHTSLLIVPTSLIYNWINEAKKFTPNLSIFVHLGQARLKDNEHFSQYDLVISTYGTTRNDEEIFINFKFHYIILDESQNIKNPQSQVSKTLRSLHGEHKLVLTGTPVENSIRDLWSQMSFVNPGLLGGLKFFEETYVNPIEKGNDEIKLNELKTLIKPFILRRTKQQVAKELPEKTEQVLYCEMTPEQEAKYEEIKSQFRNQILENIEEVGINKARFNIIAGLTKLRQLANHPYLIDKSYEGSSGKFIELLARTHTAIESGHKILIYSQFVQQLQIIKKAFDLDALKYCYFDGSHSAKERQKQVKLFQESPQIPIFLVSLKAGGVGLTLTAADYVFIVDPWWNPSVERQAIDRTHRIGQTKNIFSYKFITKNSVEEKILNLQNKKLNLASDLVLAEDSFYKSLNIDDIKNILG
jgi:SNF2 family DNA or RNA helicase